MPNRETEVKIRIEDVKGVQRQLRKIGFHLRRSRSLEDNTLFDTPDRKLRKVRSILRLRHYGRRWILTYKGTPSPDRFYKSRVEIETEIEKPQALRSLFAVLGIQPVFRYQKYRRHYASPSRKERKGDLRKTALRKAAPGEIVLDETPIGDFLELEGSRRWIDRVARQLGYSRRDYSTSSYGALYLEECRKKNILPGDMLFSRRGHRKKKTGARSPSGSTKHQKAENFLTRKR